MNRKNYQPTDVWRSLETNWTMFFWLTGEIPPTLQLLVDEIRRGYFPEVTRGRAQVIDFRNQVSLSYKYMLGCTEVILQWHLKALIYLQILLTIIWLRKYPTLSHLSTHFGIPVRCTHRIVHKCMKLLHAYIVPKYIKWHTMQHWRNLAGTYPEWPRVVAILDCTPFRISRPRG